MQPRKLQLVALGVWGVCAGTAAAQSSVTVYGLVDLAISKADAGQSNLAYFADFQIGRTNQWVLHSASSSRLGFKGVEDMGNGWKALFLIEHRFQPDTGTVEPRDGVSFPGGVRTYGNGFWNSQAYVGLSHALGEVRLGRSATPTFSIGLATDPWGMEYNVAGFAGYTRGGNFVGAANNAVNYLSPNLGGFTLNVLVGAGEGGTSVPGLALPNGRNVGFSLRYANGPLWLAYGYNDSRRSDAILNRTVQYAFTYDFGVLKAIGNVALGKNQVASNADTKTFLLGAHIPLGTGYVRTAVGSYDPAVGFNPNTVTPGATVATTPNPYAAYPVTQGQKTNKFGIGYVYNLSKRTSMSADYGTARTETYTRSSGFQTALRHSF
jgi:predicted porin